jgi:hypothetical protein
MPTFYQFAYLSYFLLAVFLSSFDFIAAACVRDNLWMSLKIALFYFEICRYLLVENAVCISLRCGTSYPCADLIKHLGYEDDGGSGVTAPRIRNFDCG